MTTTPHSETSISRRILYTLLISLAVSLGGAGPKYIEWAKDAWTGRKEWQRQFTEIQNQKWSNNHECIKNNPMIIVDTANNLRIRFLVCQQTGDVFLEYSNAGASRPEISIWVDRSILEENHLAILSGLQAQQFRVREGRVICIQRISIDEIEIVEEIEPGKCVRYTRDTYTNRIIQPAREYLCRCPPQN